MRDFPPIVHRDHDDLQTTADVTLFLFVHGLPPWVVYASYSRRSRKGISIKYVRVFPQALPVSLHCPKERSETNYYTYKITNEEVNHIYFSCLFKAERRSLSLPSHTQPSSRLSRGVLANSLRRLATSLWHFSIVRLRCSASNRLITP